MEVNDVVIGGAVKDLFELNEVMRKRIDDTFIEAQRALAARHQARSRDRIAAREERHVVTEGNQFLGQIRNDTFRTAV